MHPYKLAVIEIEVDPDVMKCVVGLTTRDCPYHVKPAALFVIGKHMEAMEKELNTLPEPGHA